MNERDVKLAAQRRKENQMNQFNVSKEDWLQLLSVVESLRMVVGNLNNQLLEARLRIAVLESKQPKE